MVMAQQWPEPEDNKIAVRHAAIIKLAAMLGMPAPVHVGSGLFCCVAEITPQIAELILARYHIENNRSKKAASIGVFASDMEANRWRLSHQGIAFNQRDLLFDGQNRLTACRKSGVPFVTKVTFNVTDMAMVNTDTGTIRNAVDAAHILGITIDNMKVTNRIVAASRVIARGPVFVKATMEHQMGVLKALRQPILFLLEQFPHHIKRVTIAPVLGALGRAYFHEDRDRLTVLCNVLKNGYVEDQAKDSAAFLLARFLQTTDLAGAANQGDAYFKTENAISNFCRGIKLAKLYAASNELYPLPIEIRAELQGFAPDEE